MVEKILQIEALNTSRFGTKIHTDLSLDVYENEVLVVLGESGSGKTTLLRTIVGLEPPDRGRCHFEGRDLFNIDANEWPEVRTKIAYAFQGGALFDSISVLENLEFPLKEHTNLGRKERHEKVVKQLATLGLGRIEHLMPAELSGGMQKRVGVARAIILNPKIILYDEPTAGLDPTNIGRINETILRLKSLGKTSIVVTHDPLCALEVADRFVFLGGGSIRSCQSMRDYQRTPDPLIKTYFSGNMVDKSLNTSTPSGVNHHENG